jgi:hypothetical protein
MTLWPRLSTSRSDIGNGVEVEDMFTLRPAPSTEFQDGCGSQVGWGAHVCKVVPGCMTNTFEDTHAVDGSNEAKL